MLTSHMDVLLPIILVAIAFLLKLFMDRNATLPLVIRSLYELPVDIVFLTLSFTTAYTIADTTHLEKGMCGLYIFLAVALVAVILWRRSTMLYEQARYFYSSGLFVLNGTIAGYVLYRSVVLVTS